jgi:vacuolar-type H+-ATPase subunit F/Vma7
MAELIVITGSEAAVGYRLGGFDCVEVKDEEDISLLLETIVREGRYGLVCIEERFLEYASSDLMRRVMKKGLPVIIPVNMPRSWSEGGPEESPIAGLIRRAIGYQIKMKK